MISDPGYTSAALEPTHDTALILVTIAVGIGIGVTLLYTTAVKQQADDTDDPVEEESQKAASSFYAERAPPVNRYPHISDHDHDHDDGGNDGGNDDEVLVAPHGPNIPFPFPIIAPMPPTPILRPIRPEDMTHAPNAALPRSTSSPALRHARSESTLTNETIASRARSRRAISPQPQPVLRPVVAQTIAVRSQRAQPGSPPAAAPALLAADPREWRGYGQHVRHNAVSEPSRDHRGAVLPERGRNHSVSGPESGPRERSANRQGGLARSTSRAGDAASEGSGRGRRGRLANCCRIF